MKAITICEPWASLIVDGVKPIENRAWATGHRGALLIHAGLDRRFWELAALQRDAFQRRYGVTLPAWQSYRPGCIIGVVTMTGCVAVDRLPQDFRSNPFAEGPMCFLLTQAQRFRVPVRWRGEKGLWDLYAGHFDQARRDAERAAPGSLFGVGSASAGRG